MLIKGVLCGQVRAVFNFSLRFSVDLRVQLARHFMFGVHSASL